ncbi:EAL domain-containing protein [Aestuariivirga sp.]|uniref:EAL domain-containing protein n=1 Tax=Aestuariivirga sp. TaxID=2650926 RepID=UPI003593AB56
MNLLRSAGVWRDVGISLACATAISGLALLAHDFWQKRHNIGELKTLADSAIKQVEYNIDYAILAAFEAVEKAPQPCLPEAQVALQSLVHGGSNLKDLIVLDSIGKQLCAAFPGLERKSQVSAGVATRNENFALHRLSYAERDNLGVAWRDGTRSYVISLDLDAQLYTTLPGEIRDDAYNSIEVAGLGEIASFGREMGEGEAVPVTASSERFPVQVVLKLENASFAEWNGGNRWIVTMFGLIIGLMLGALAVRELRRPVPPREALRRALANREIIPFAQATFELTTRRITGCEILMRWIKTDGIMIPPSQFIPLAEVTNMIVPMTRHVITHTLGELSEYLQRNREFKVAFNVVPSDFISPDFAREILKITSQAGVATRQVVLEITERQAVDDSAALRSAVQQARDLGFKVALDDMGTGQNGLSSVQDVPLDIIKIDKKFVDTVGKEVVADAIITLLVGLAQKLNLKTTAEGIETVGQLDALHKAGVTHGQGYLVGKPMPLAEFLAKQERATAEPQSVTQRAAA